MAVDVTLATYQCATPAPLQCSRMTVKVTHPAWVVIRSLFSTGLRGERCGLPSSAFCRGIAGRVSGRRTGTHDRYIPHLWISRLSGTALWRPLSGDGSRICLISPLPNLVAGGVGDAIHMVTPCFCG